MARSVSTHRFVWEQQVSAPSSAASEVCSRAAEASVEDLGGGIRRQILGFGETLMTCRLWFERDAIGTMHRHPHAQTTYVETGRFHYRVGDTAWDIGPGDCIFVAPDTDHGLSCIEAGSVIDNFSPLRADFLVRGESR